MQYGLFEYTTRNLGDEIQSLAAKNYLPEVDIYVKRDYLNQVTSNDEINLIMNGWFSHHPENWPPSSCINPLFISFHITESAIPQFTTKRSIDYFKKHEPIGCRDQRTRDILQKHGVDAYFSGCLTLTLSSQYSDQISGEVLLVDLEKETVNHLPAELAKKSEELTHVYGPPALRHPRQYAMGKSSAALEAIFQRVDNKIDLNYSTVWDSLEQLFCSDGRYREDKFVQAQQKLDRYAQAELVITSRLHVTLPCLAFDTRVVLVHENPQDPRFSGLKPYLPLYSKNEFKENTQEILDKIEENRKPIDYLTESLGERVDKFIGD